jgi:hypothetical protein
MTIEYENKSNDLVSARDEHDRPSLYTKNFFWSEPRPGPGPKKHRFRSCLVIVYILAGNLEITDTTKYHTAYLARKYIIKNRFKKFL